LFVDRQCEVNKQPFPATKFAGAAPATSQPFVANAISKILGGRNRLFEQFNGTHPAFSISPNPWQCRRLRRAWQLTSSSVELDKFSVQLPPVGVRWNLVRGFAKSNADRGWADSIAEFTHMATANWAGL
jgi:hypothetical protein